jgi:LmbE family N-acetylglucosaminyl deacetylase
MRQIVTNDDIASLGTILGVWAHPDDEVFNMGGIMAVAVKNGQKVICVTATRGELGVQDETRWPPSRLGEIRTKELDDAYKILGVKEHHWFDYPDGGCVEVDENEAVTRVVELIEKYQPDSIFTFGPDGMTGHSDHISASHWATKAREQANSQAPLYYSVQTKEQYQSMQEADERLNIFFNIDKPDMREEKDCDILLRLSDEIYEQKIAALAAMPSQMEHMLDQFGDKLRPGLGIEAFYSKS